MEGKRVAVLQSNYIPWKGYFDIINSVDEFVLYDDMQYTKRDWRNRNKIQTSNGLKWLTIPVDVKGRFFQKIKDTTVNDSQWNIKHWDIIKSNYRNAKYFNEYKQFFEELYLTTGEKYLSEINFKFINAINSILGIDTKIRWSSEFELHDGKTEKLLGICKDCDADIYLSGPAAKGYFDEELARKSGILIQWADYSNYKEYSQLYSPFEHRVSIIDLLFNEGSDAPKFMHSFK